MHEHKEWINSEVPVMKEDGSLRLCLDPKDLNKAIKRNQWYEGTICYILIQENKTWHKVLRTLYQNFKHYEITVLQHDDTKF